ncbi:MAG: hypothetical protein IJC39_00465 [Firmicutes bacterium]|nr:hypothetical protein [Bacillota bacterium]
MKKRFKFLCVALILGFVFLEGCNSKEDTTTEPSTQESSSAEEASDATEAIAQTENLASKEETDLLKAALGERLAGKVLIETGGEEVGGVLCKTFALGSNGTGKFVAEQHFAVSPEGKIYYIDTAQSPDWLPYN